MHLRSLSSSLCKKSVFFLEDLHINLCEMSISLKCLLVRRCYWLFYLLYAYLLLPSKQTHSSQQQCKFRQQLFLEGSSKLVCSWTFKQNQLAQCLSPGAGDHRELVRKQLSGFWFMRGHIPSLKASLGPCRTTALRTEPRREENRRKGDDMARQV